MHSTSNTLELTYHFCRTLGPSLHSTPGDSNGSCTPPAFYLGFHIPLKPLLHVFHLNPRVVWSPFPSIVPRLRIFMLDHHI
jgi:hypothetical protein